MSRYIVAIDQGTTSSRAVLFDETGKLLFLEQMPFGQHFPNDGWVEHDANEIWNTTATVIQKLVTNNNIDPQNIACIGITNQRETTVIWDRKTGEPIYRAIVWQDRRTADVCAKLKSEGLESTVKQKTGLLLDPYFSGTKIAWILDNVDGARKRAEKGELAFGTIDTFLLFRLTDGRCHKTDATNASRTMIFNIEDQSWDQELLDALDIPGSLLPQVCDSCHEFGETSVLGNSVPITAMVGDQQGALVGQCCFETGAAKITFGTGGFLMVNTGDKIVHSQNQLLSTMGYRLDGKPVYAMEGSIFIAGAAVKWLGEDLGFFSSAKQTGALARSADPNSKAIMVPAFTGLGAPHWDPDARGAMFGLTRNTGIREIVAATLESIAFQTMDLLGAIEKDGASLKELRVDGGMAANDWFNQTLANVIGLPVLRQSIIETTALGTCYLAGLGSGLFKSLTSLQSNWLLDQRFEPDPKRDKWQAKYANWQDRIGQVLTTK